MPLVTTALPVEERHAETASAQRLRLYWALAGAIILLGVLLRVWGYFEYELWYDEAFWARRLYRSVAASARPVGYTYLSHYLVRWHDTEPVIRLPSLVAGIASLPLLVALLRLVRVSWPVTSFALFVFAINPWAITASKEFKPYALELMLHLALLVLTASYLRTRKLRDLVLLGALGVLSTAFAWSVAMLLPWLFFLLLALSWRERNRLHSLVVFAGGTLTAASLAAIFYLRLLGTGKERSAERFANKYDVFFTGNGWLEHARWMLAKTADVAAFPADIGADSLGDGVRSVLDGLHVVAAIAGCVYLVRRRSLIGIVAWLGTWLTAIVLGMAKVWPYGVFRTNLFLLVYALLLVTCGVQLLSDWALKRPVTKVAALVVAAAYVVLVFPYSIATAAEKTAGGATASVRRSLETIKAYEEATPGRTGPKPLLLMDGLSCSPFDYYTRSHVVAREQLGSFFRQNAERACQGRGTKQLKRAIKRSASRGFWVMVSKSSYIATVEREVQKRCTPDVLLHLPGPSLLAHCPRR